MNRRPRFAEALTAVRNGGDGLEQVPVLVIRNFTLEPIFETFFRYYGLYFGYSMRIEYCDENTLPSDARFNEARSFEILEGVYNTVILRDVMERNNNADLALLHKLVLFLCSNIGSITSPNKIGNILSDEGDIQKVKKISGKDIAGRTVDRYIRMLRSAFVFYPVGRYDVKGKQFLKTLEKNYIIDLGFRNMLLGYRDADRVHMSYQLMSNILTISNE